MLTKDSSSVARLLNLLKEGMADLPTDGRLFGSEVAEEMLANAHLDESSQALVSEGGEDAGITQLYLIDGARQMLGGTCTCNAIRRGVACRHLWGLLLGVQADLQSSEPREKTLAFARLVAPSSDDVVLAQVSRLVARHDAATTRSPDKWIAWRIAAYPQTGFQISAVVRAVLKSGKPGKGRAVSQAALPDLMEYGNAEQDAAVADQLRSMQSTAYRDEFSYYRAYAPPPTIGGIPPIKLLQLIAGHSDIAWLSDGQPVTVMEKPAGLAIAEDESAYHLRLSLGDEVIANGPRTVIEKDGAAAWTPDRKRLTVGLWAPRSASLAVDLLRANISVPTALGAALVQKLAPARKALSIALPPSLAGRIVPTDSRPILVCEPQPVGAFVRVVVRPLPGVPQQVPGEGEKDLTAFVGNDRLSTTRSFTEEVAQASALLELLDVPARPTELWNRMLETDEKVLDLVSKLQEPEFAAQQVEWPGRPQLVSQNVRTMRVQLQSKEDWFGIEGSAEIDGVTIALADLINVARSGRRYVAIGQGKYAQLERTFRDRLAHLSDLIQQGRRGMVLSPIAAPLAEQVFDGFELIAPLEWTKLIDRVKKARTTTPKVPKTLKATLRDYQTDGFRWLWRLSQMGVGGVLADDMGLGKTVQAIAMLLTRASGGPQLILAPTSVGFNWQNELERFAPSLRVVDFRVGDRHAAIDTVGPGDVVIASYGLARFSLEALQKITWHMLVLDEAQAFKNYDTHTARAVRSLKAHWKIALTGTPLENHLGELYSLMHTVCPGLLGSWDHFSGGFARPIEREKNTERRDALARMLRPFILRRTKGQVLKELPDRTEVRLDATLSKQERTLYEATRLATLSALADRDDKKDPRFVIFAALTRLRQIASHARMVEPSAPKISAKQALLMGHLEEVLGEGHTALVFSQFTTQLKLIEEEMHARGMKTLYLDGSTPAKERRRLVESFQRGDAPVFLVSLKAGGTGLNLTAADYVFLMDPWWNPAVEDQAADRVHRIGQQRPVTIVRLVALGTVEEKVLSLHAQKRQLVAGVLDGADVAGRLNTDELVDLLREGQAVPGEKPGPRKHDSDISPDA